MFINNYFRYTILSYFLMLLPMVSYGKENAFSILFDRETINLGKLESGEIIKETVGFTNGSTNVVTIKEIKSSCPCVSGKTNKNSYAPKEKGVLEITTVVGVSGKQTYWLGVETETGKNFVKVEYEAIKNYAISPATILLDVCESENKKLSQKIEVFYHGDVNNRLPLKEVKTSHSALISRIIKHNWTSDELSSTFPDVIKRPPVAEISLELGDNTKVNSLERQESLSLVFGDGDNKKVINVPIRFTTSKLYKIYPSPVVKTVEMKDGHIIFAEDVLIDSVAQDTLIHHLAIMGSDANSPLLLNIVEQGEGKYILKLGWKPDFSGMPQRGQKYKGDILLSISIGSTNFQEKVPYFLICR